jgi:opacity protein-like surface antigen
MTKWSAVLAGVAIMFAVVPTPEAEAQTTFGPQFVLWDFDKPAVGARVNFGLASTFGIEDGFFSDLAASINGSYIFGDSESFGNEEWSWSGLAINVNGIVPIDIEAGVTPFVGAGINHTRFSSSFSGTGLGSFGFSGSSSGLNLVGGVELPLGGLRTFAELQYSTTGTGPLSVSVGVLFGG